MRWIEVKIVFDHPDKDLAVDLISDVFYDFGLQGVVVEDPRIEPEEGWPQDIIGRPDHHTVIGYFPEDSRIENRRRILEEKLAHFKEKLDLIYRIESDQDNVNGFLTGSNSDEFLCRMRRSVRNQCP